MTKEPKLQAAVRIVPEWQDYDQEIKQLQVRFQEEKEAGTLYQEETPEQPQEGRRALPPPVGSVCSLSRVLFAAE